MWTTDFSATTDASAAAVWAALRDLHSGTPLGLASDRFELHGPFAVGTRVTVTPQGQDAMTSEIVELEPGHVYADRTAFGGLTLTFRHTLVEQEGRTSVTHTVEIAGEEADAVGPELGPQIAGDFPVAMAELLAAAEARSTGAPAEAARV
ncbi:SRPBCC family protein [Leifsonia sp. F6_8S_P_1B]|uniref:SRPBCC family protein n=1 Tax=Leifsonia williamsii TaxID=3035919 RepID=A0ABT8K7B4_9MICO|nr:SRPBCC family protein [Leifsonia williamsii]MDN4613338.1 SRPBCC family protein [Leifsonia williamsii]